MTTTGKWALVAMAAAALAAGRDASASCAQRRSLQTFQNQAPPYIYAYILPGNGADVSQKAIRGRFWSLGDRATANEGTYSDDTWIYPSANGININARLDAQGVVGCPAADATMIAVVETVTQGGGGARFVALTASETRLQPVRWDFSRVNRQFAMVDIPAPQPLGPVLYSTTNQNWTAHVSISATTAALFGPGVSTALTGYGLFAGASNLGRDATAWTDLRTTVPSQGALVSDVALTLACPPPPAKTDQYVVVRPRFDSQVLSDYVGAATKLVCDTCIDGVKDFNETDLDCGGADCSGCATGKACLQNNDCITGLCSNSTCVSSCPDGIRDGKETDVDCGGGICPACAANQHCNVGSDCLSGTCTAGACAP